MMDKIRRSPVLLLCSALMACSSVGPTRLPADHFNYNDAIGRSSNEQMLLNLVRIRYRDLPVFLSVSSVISQYLYAANSIVSGQIAQTGGSYGGAAGLLYSERPTITYTPLLGKEFADQLLEPIDNSALFSLVESGWRADQLLLMTLERVNDLRNMPSDPGASSDANTEEATFARVVKLMVELMKRQALDTEDLDQEGKLRQVVFAGGTDPETQSLIAEVKRLLDLDAKRDEFTITTRIISRQPDEITLRVRSLLALMGFLSRGVEIPPQHRTAERVEVVDAAGHPLGLDVPFRIQAGVDAPSEAFVAVRYQDHWFFIAHADHRSKQIFALLTYLFQIQAPQPPGQIPTITVPTG